MINPESSPNKWKAEQISYFKEYIKSFKPGSSEYNKLDQGIKELEKHSC